MSEYRDENVTLLMAALHVRAMSRKFRSAMDNIDMVSTEIESEEFLCITQWEAVEIAVCSSDNEPIRPLFMSLEQKEQ